MRISNVTIPQAVQEFLEEATEEFREYLENLLETPYDGLDRFIENGGSDGNDLLSFFNALYRTVHGATAQSVFDEIVVQLREVKKKKAEDAKRKQEELQKSFDQDEPVGDVSEGEVIQNAT